MLDEMKKEKKATIKVGVLGPSGNENDTYVSNDMAK